MEKPRFDAVCSGGGQRQWTKTGFGLGCLTVKRKKKRRWRFGQAKMEEGGSFCLRAVGFLNLFSCTALANSMAVSSSVWCGGGLGKQIWKREGRGSELLFNFFLRSLFGHWFGEGFK